MTKSGIRFNVVAKTIVLAFTITVLTLLSSATVLAATAQGGDENQTPEFELGNYTLKDFASLPKVRKLGLSPNGTYFTAVISAFGSQVLAIENIKEDVKPFYARGDAWDLRWFEWITDKDLILSISVPSTMYGTPVTVTRLVYIDVEKSEMKMMFERERRETFHQIQDDFLGSLPSDPGYFLLGARLPGKSNTAIYRVKVGARALPGRRYYPSKANIYDWRVDRDGDVRAGYGFTNNQKSSITLLMDAQGNAHDYSGFSGGNMRVAAFPTHDKNLAYVELPDGEFEALYELNIPERKLGKKIAGHPDSDIAGVKLNRDGSEIEVIYYDNEQVADEYRGGFTERLKLTADQHFKETTNYVETIAADESAAIISAASATQPLHYYVYRATSPPSISYLASTYPTLMDNAPGDVFSMNFTARDGLSIPAYVTLPKGIDPSNMRAKPFVVYPHGGPAARDFLRFDWVAQMLVAAGYGVMQINFRGSTGYGRAFKEAGHKQWGQAMQDDLTDGTRWLIDNGMAKETGICIFGGSYGGYAAMMGAAKEPDLYQCAASLNGVSDLRALVRKSSNYIGGRFGTRFIGRLWKDRKMLRDNSPIELVDQIKVPILLVHGEQDRIVPVAQSRRMRRALDDKLYKYVELPEGDHYLGDETNRMRFAYELLTFLDQHLKAGQHLESAAAGSP